MEKEEDEIIKIDVDTPEKKMSLYFFTIILGCIFFGGTVIFYFFGPIDSILQSILMLFVLILSGLVIIYSLLQFNQNYKIVLLSVRGK